jgi:hypothetical protein
LGEKETMRYNPKNGGFIITKSIADLASQLGGIIIGVVVQGKAKGSMGCGKIHVVCVRL